MMIISAVKDFWTTSIRRQMMVGVILVHAVLMSIFVYDLVDKQRTFLHEQSISQAKSLTETLAANSVSWILSDDYIGLEEVLNSQRHYPGLRYAMVLSPDGRVLGHSDTTKVGLYISKQEIALLAEAKRKVQRTLFDTVSLIDVVSPIFSNGQFIGWSRVGLGQDDIVLGLALLTRNGILYTLLAIFIGTLFAFFMAKSITKDLKHLVDVADGIKRGDLQLRSVLTRKDEIGHLSTDFNLMLDTIKKSEELQKNYQATLEQQVSERTQELEKKADQLQRATRLKSEFLANMSHELRTPMNSIIGFTSRVIKKASEQLNERQLNNLHTVERNGRHLLSLINSMLDLSKIEAGKMDVHAEVFDLTSLVKDVCNLTQTMLENKNVQLIVDIPEDGIKLNTDNIKLKQVLINLVSNAIKFTNEGSVIVSAELQNKETEPKVAIRVTDTGVGMNEESLQYVFDAFRQVDGSLTRKIGGTGLGLAIVRSFSELLKGSVMVESEEGVGTTFEVVIPVSLNDSESDNYTAKPDLPIPQNYSNETPTILCIDDEAEVLELISGYLSDDGYQVVTSMDPEEAMALAKELKPLAITLDIMMPHKDGWSVLSDLKSSEETRNIPVFIISFLDNKALGYQLGAFDYLQKPVEPERLINGIKRLSQKQMQSALIVDDDQEARELMCDILTDEGIKCETAVDGKDALSYLKKASELPEIILLDLMMPVMDGFELLRQMQENTKWADIPVIIVTAKTIEEHEQDFLQPRVASILSKEGLTSEKVLKQLTTSIKRLNTTN